MRIVYCVTRYASRYTIRLGRVRVSEMVFTLHRYIFRELMRIFVLATLALTLMLSIGMILQPVQEYGVGPEQVIHLMGYFLPIILTYILPMAALFSASLVYGRFANDNELDACRASGISLLTLVYPGLCLAIMVSIANLILSFYVVPAFVQRAEKALKADAQQIIFRNIQRKGYYRSTDKRYMIYADQANIENSTLSGVIIIELKGAGIEKITTAENARINFISHGMFNKLHVTANNTYQMGKEGEGGFSAKQMSITKEFPPLLGDDIRFKKIDEIKKIKADPMRFYPIAKQARQVFSQFIAELLAEDIRSKTAGASEKFYKLHSAERFVNFTTTNCTAKGQKVVELSGQTVVIEYDSSTGLPLLTCQTSKVLLHLEGDELAPTLTMEIYNPTWQRADGLKGIGGRRIIRGLILPKAVTDKLASDDVLELLSTASLNSALQGKPSSKLLNLQNLLSTKIRKTFIDIKTETHTRLVFGIGCVSMVLIGIGLSIIKRGGHLLGAFGAGCIPAAVLIVSIAMGANVAKNAGSQQMVSGIGLMWSGLVILCVLTLIIYRKLLKN